MVRPTAKPMNPGTLAAVVSHARTFDCSCAAAQDDATHSIAAVPPRSHDEIHAIFASIQSLDFPDVRLNASVLELVKGLHHEAVGADPDRKRPFGLEPVHLLRLRDPQQLEHEQPATACR